MRSLILLSLGVGCDGQIVCGNLRGTTNEVQEGVRDCWHSVPVRASAVLEALPPHRLHGRH